MNDTKSPDVSETQTLHKIEIEAFEYLGKAIERLDKVVQVLNERITKLEEDRSK